VNPELTTASLRQTGNIALSYCVKCISMSWSVLVWRTSVTDGWTDGRTHRDWHTEWPVATARSNVVRAA